MNTFSLEKESSKEIKLLQLELLKFIFRDKKRTELDCFIPITSLLINLAGFELTINQANDKNRKFEIEMLKLKIFSNF